MQRCLLRWKKDGVISTRGLESDANLYGELIFDVNSAYFYNHGGYEFAKQFYEDAYKAAVEIVGSEQYILSAVMHADEAQPGHVRGTGAGCVSLSSPCGLCSSCGEADPLVQEVQRQVSCGNRQKKRSCR